MSASLVLYDAAALATYPAELRTLLDASEPHLVGVHPELARRGRNYVCTLYAAGLYFGAHMGLRTWEQQHELFLKVPRVTKADAGQSSHNYGLAIDFVEDGDPEQAGVQWSWKNNADYLKCGALAKICGLEWGGFWKSFMDYPHVSLTCGLTLKDCRALYQVNGNVDNIWAEIDRRLAQGIVSTGW